MKVKTIRPHGNSYGKTWQKAKGTDYEVTDAVGRSLVSAGYVEEVKEKAAPAAKGSPGGDGKAD